MRCAEVVVGILNDPVKVDPTYASAFRTVMTTNRLIRKQAWRAESLRDNICSIQKKAMPPGAHGPARGLLNALEVAGLGINVTGAKLTLTDPLGSSVDLATENNSELAACLRSSIRVTIMRQLSKSANVINPETGKPKRRDMMCVPYYVDVDLTKALLHAKQCSEDQGAGCITECRRFGRRMRLSGTGKNTLKQILAGSIRPPHRLVHAGYCGSAFCPLCGAENADAEHVLWDCPELEDVRKPHTEEINRIINEAQAASVWRGSMLK